jgi:hypothetical protein
MAWRRAKLLRDWTWRLLLALAMSWTYGGVAAVAAPKPAKKSAPATCNSSVDNEDDDDDDGVRFSLAGACNKLTGGVSYGYQRTLQTVSGLPIVVNRNGTVSNASNSTSASANIGLETTRQTNLGEFKTTVSADWSKATDDGTVDGTASVTGWSVGLDGKLGDLTVGYTGTLMSFWEGDFLSTANSPGRAANTIVYEYKIDDRNTVAAGLESNLPTTPQTESGLKSFEFSEPVYTLRWRYESDAATLHASGLARRADFSNSPLLPLFPDTATVRTGWAASAGIKLPVAYIAEDDELSFQATYAVDASSYLGISTDLTVYQSVVRSTGPTTGWSAVASFHHVWSEQFESNLFGSFVSLRGDLLLAKPEAQTFRSGINVFWKPMDKVKFGVEFGYFDGKLDSHGVPRFFNGVGGDSYSGYLSVSVEL